MKSLYWLVFALCVGALGACGGSINPDRPPLLDYEPPPLGDWSDQSRPPDQRV